MALKPKLEADLKQAMLQKNETVRDTLRLLLAEFKRLEIQEGKTVTPEIEQDVLLTVQAALVVRVDDQVVLDRDMRKWGVWPKFGVETEKWNVTWSADAPTASPKPKPLMSRKRRSINPPR